MAEELEQIQSTDAPTGGEPASSAAPSIDPEEYQRLKEYEAQSRPLFEKLSPYSDDVIKFVENEPYREVARQAWQGYDAIQQSQKPEVPEYVENLNKKLDKVDRFVETVQQREYMQAQANQILTLAQQYPALAQDNYKPVQQLIERAQRLKINSVESFIEYVKDQAPYISGPPAATAEHKPETKPKTAPKSLRGDASVPGLADSPQTVQMDKKGVRKFIRQAVGSAGGR